MFRKQGLYFILSIAIAGMLSSCSSANKFASSFGKRKYEKGYYRDAPTATKEAISTSNSTKPSISPIANNTLGHIYLTDQVITVKREGTISTVSVKTNVTTPVSRKEENYSSKLESAAQQPSGVVINNDAPPTDGTKFADSKHEVNLWAILGCSLSIIGAVLTAIAGVIYPYSYNSFGYCGCNLHLQPFPK